ncbi:unnamed protein product [Miscanthus lutarioriparius]|uniref:Uncharacterized protein n=1 Tax=Miscanthus lutarioriparius TaxID=422564 RepID=A0A811MKS0_9POAL|nr:unnamed protein product [Miscanthus lutarioriparius]
MRSGASMSINFVHQAPYENLPEGRIAYVMSFEVGAVLEDAAWQAPEYCFTKDGGLAAETTTKISDGHHGSSFIPRSVL